MKKPNLSYSAPQSLIAGITDTRTPLSYKEWLVRNTGVSVGAEYQQYLQYVRTWYSQKEKRVVATKEQIRNAYLAVLRELPVGFKDDAEANWLRNINLEDTFEVETAIPIFARKLKEVALYLARKRDSIKTAKLKYNMAGSSEALEKIFHEYLLQAFTKKSYTVNVARDAYDSLPELSAVNTKFNIKIEELYDDTSYFDHDPKMPVQSYFDISNVDTIEFYDTLGIPSSALEWLFSTGMYEVCANNSAIWNEEMVLAEHGVTTLSELPTSAFEAEDRARLNVYNLFDLTKKYIGNSQYMVLSGGFFTPTVREIELPIKSGNNWFYWPSGEFYNDVDLDFSADPIALSATNFKELGTSSSEINNADLIFVQRDNEPLKGAWLRSPERDVRTVQMSCILQANGDTIFRFPFPGYGVSGESLDWSGMSISNFDRTFEYLNKEEQASILSEYWSASVANTAINIISINETALVDSGAHASGTYSTADKVIIRDVTDSEKDQVYTGTHEHAWLYKMTHTDIPISIGTNLIYWPIQRYDEGDVIPLLVKDDHCDPIAVSALSFVGSVAAETLTEADIIYKTRSQNGRKLEAAWLSGQPLKDVYTASSGYKGVVQPGMSFKCEPGEFASFVWCGSATEINQVFRHFDHQIDCPYETAEKFSLYHQRPFQQKGDVDYDLWKKCNCHALYYSPAGHPGSDFNEYEQIADFVVANYSYPEPFDFNNWRDTNGNPWYESEEFAWFKVSPKGIEDIGWNSGRFVTPVGTDFIFLPGVAYSYYRTNLNRASETTSNTEAPYFVGRYHFNNRNTAWVKASLSASGDWYTTGQPSDMIINPGNFIQYDHVGVIPEIVTNDAASSSINFPLNIKLSGWSYSLNRKAPDLHNGGAKPFWASASESKEEKISVWGGGTKVVDEYVLITQPTISNLQLSAGNYFEYKHNGRSFNWYQDVTLRVVNTTAQWCELQLNTDSISTLSAALGNNITDLSVSATHVVSDIVLHPSSVYKKSFVNYFAQQEFSFTQELTDTSVGDTWVDSLSANLFEPNAPYANLLNRHYPTIASVPDVSNLYSTEEVGGYFTPKNLGVGVFVSKKVKSKYQTS